MNADAIALRGAAGTADLRLTPWDERALGIRTAELSGFAPADAAGGGALLAQAEAWCRDRGVACIFGRFDAAQPHAKQALLESGHAIVECSLVISRRGFSGLPTVPARMRPVLRPATAVDVPLLRSIARDDFGHGRFLEDPSIDRARAAERTANWIEDLVGMGLAQAAECDGKLIGFHAERISEDGSHAELILTGAAARYEVLGLPLWVAALDSLATRGVASCSTLVSAANTGIVNLYSRLGFRCDATLFGFRKYL